LTVFGPCAPQLSTSPVLSTPKRPRDVPAVDDVADLLARLGPSASHAATVASENDVHCTADLLAKCQVPGKRPRTQPRLQPPMLRPNRSEVAVPVADTLSVANADVDADDDELSFLVQRCDLDSQSSERVDFMPYIA
jgi:hypothetical protein